MIKEMLKFIDESQTSFQAVETISNILLKNDYKELKEDEDFNIQKGKKYFIRRNGSSIIAFNIGKKLKDASVMITASHTDCPSFKIKPNALIKTKEGYKLNVEPYGGALFNPWFDRPLGIAGRIIVKNKNVISTQLFDSKKAFCIIPNVAIHFNREANKGIALNPQVDMLPLITVEDEFNFEEYLAKEAKTKKENILGFDLYLYPIENGYVWGQKNELFSCHHIDNLECAYTTLQGFINNFNDENINVYASFDNEETGSLTRQGADSDFLGNTLERVFFDLGLDYYQMLAKGMMLSCDNAHGVHINHPEKSDPTNNPHINKGIVIKYNANQSYTSDSLSAAIFKDILIENKIPYQMFTNRSDSRGGGTLGNISQRHVSLMTVDIGLAQLAMHSPIETAGVKDYEYMIKAMKAFYSKHIVLNNGYIIK